jgi:tetratricopeptide (TPR) repeat protein
MDPGLALELGSAYMRVARVQGVNISVNLGQTAQAEITAQKAQTLIDSVLRSQPRNRIALLRAGQIAHDRMILAADGGHREDTMRFARASVARLNEFLSVRALDPKSDHMDAQQVILALINVANQYMRADQYDEAIRICERAIQIANATDWSTQAGAALMIVALSHRAKGELDDALRAVRESVRLLEPEKGETRTGRLYPYGLALIREGQILGEDESISLNRPQGAAGYIERALKIGVDLARDPNDFQSQFRVFTAEIKLAGILRHNEPGRASELCDDALQRLSMLTANAGTPRHEILTMAACVDPLLRLGRRAEARKRLDGALDRLSRVKQYPASQIDLGSPADSTLRAAAEYEAVEGGPRRGAARYDELIKLIVVSNPKAESRLEDAVKLSSLYQAAAQLHRKAGQTDQAAGLDARRLKLWQHWDAALPNNPFVRRQLEDTRPHQLRNVSPEFAGLIER